MSDLPLFDPFKALEEVRRELPQKLPQHRAEAKAQSIERVRLTPATSATSAGCERANELAHARANDVVCKNYSSSSDTYARKGASDRGRDQSCDMHPAEVAEVAENLVSHSYCEEICKSRSAEVSTPLLRKWREGLNRLSPDRIPCRDYRPDEWAAVLSSAWASLDRFGAQAEALGWHSHELFGVHPTHGTIRVDHCGALILVVAGPVRAITADAIRFERVTYRRRPHAPIGVLIWEVAR